MTFVEFDPTTAYADEWKHQDQVESVTWEQQGGDELTGLKGRWGDFDTADLQSVAAALGLTNEAAAVVIWQPNDPKPTRIFAPAEGDILRREAKSGEGWLVKAIIKSLFGYCQLACQREVLNG